MKKLSLSLAAGLMAATMGVAYGQEEMPGFNLDPVNVTALGYEKSNFATPADIATYTGEELAQTGASNVAGALKFKAGVIFTQMGPHDQSFITGNSAINLRGIKGGTLVLINGVPAGFNNVSHLDMLSLDMVEKVEVVKGGGAVLYGSEAYGGVINIITKDTYKNQLQVAAGNKGLRNYAATVNAGPLSIAVGHNEMGATGNISQYMGTKTISGSKVGYYVGFGDSQKDHLGLNYKLNDRLTLQYMYNKKDYTIDYNDVKGNKLQHFMYDDEEHYGQLRYDDKKGLNGVIYYNQRNIENPDYYIVNPTNLEWEKSQHKHYGADVKKLWQNDKEQILVGVKAKRETYNNDNQKFASFGNSSSALKPVAHFGTYSLNGYSIYGQYDRALSKATDLVISVREDIIQSDAGDYDTFLPQVQLSTKLDSSNMLYANVGRSFRMPTFRQLYYSSGVLLQNPDLKPEYGWNYEAGYKYQGEKDLVKVALFNIQLEDQITTRKVGAQTQSYNAAEYKNTGVEVSYTKELNDQWSVTVGGIYNNPKNKASETADWKRVLGKYQLMTSLDWHNEKTAASFNMSYMGDRVKNSNQAQIEPLLLSSLHVQHQLLPQAKLTLDINNIFDRRDLTDPDNLYLTQGRSFIVGMSYSF